MILILTTKYDPKKPNKAIAALTKKLSLKKVPFELATFSDIEVTIERNKVEARIKNQPLDHWTTIYPRKVGSFRAMAHILARLAKKKNIYFIDQYHNHTKDSSDAAKVIQMFRLGNANISIPKTYYAVSYSSQQIENAIKHLKLPIIIKECSTSQGAGVFIAKSQTALKKTLSSLLKKEDKKEIFLQEFIPNSFEYRILVTGNKVAICEKKIRTKKGEFRNNVFLGAREEFINPSKVKSSTRKEALAAAKITDIQVAGVDIVEKSDGTPIIFEVNSCPCFTLDENISQEIPKLVEYLEKCEKRK